MPRFSDRSPAQSIPVQQKLEQPYILVFNATTDWTLNGEDYEITVLEAVHGKGIAPRVEVVDSSGELVSPRIDPDLAAAGDVVMKVSSEAAGGADSRFAGSIFVWV